jgi:hypothetical protein
MDEYFYPIRVMSAGVYVDLWQHIKTTDAGPVLEGYKDINGNAVELPAVHEAYHLSKEKHISPGVLPPISPLFQPLPKGLPGEQPLGDAPLGAQVA